MRSDYYDPRRPRIPRSPQESRGGPAGAEPYGAVPPQTGQSGPERDLEKPEAGVDRPNRTPDVWQRSSRPQRKRSGKSGIPGFLCCLILLLGLTGLTVWSQGGIAVIQLLQTFEETWQNVYQWPRSDDSWDIPWSDDWQYGEEEDWTEALSDTSVKRAPLGDGTTLILTGETGSRLTPQEIYEKVNPSIVGIQSLLRDGRIGLGTGIIMSGDGYILTNAHVIAGSRELSVLLSDGTRTDALLVGYDGSTDLAVLKVALTDLPVADFGDSEALRVGDPAYAIGNPLGEELRGTMTDGIISAIDRVVSAENGEMTLIQTTAALNPGNSGGALVNAAGQVVGITNMKMMAYEDEVYEGLGFAIPTAAAKEVVDQIIEQGHCSGKPMLGITVTTQAAEGETPAGALVVSVEPKADAYRKGLRAGHIITAVDGESISDMDGLLAAKEGRPAGDMLLLEVWNGTTRQTMRVRIMEQWELEN